MEVERANYLEAIADKYNIGFDNLRKLVNSYAAQTGLVKPMERPKQAAGKKNTPEENGKRVQRMLLTWLTDYPELFSKITKYIAPSDFTEDLYKKVAERLFADMEAGNYNPAGIINMFEDEAEQEKAIERYGLQAMIDFVQAFCLREDEYDVFLHCPPIPEVTNKKALAEANQVMGIMRNNPSFHTF